jgi:serine/arginine repetitive matrix protein 2
MLVVSAPHCSIRPFAKFNTLDLGPEIALDLLPIEPSNLDTGVIPDSSSVTTIHLSLPSFGSSNNPPDRDNGDVLQEWLPAFQQCFQFTLRSLSFPSPSGLYLVHGPNVDLEADTRESVMAILNSGLPIPKSPSIQMEDAELGYPEDARRQEREERGWWSLRFQQVLREMQRQEVPLVFMS